VSVAGARKRTASRAATTVAYTEMVTSEISDEETVRQVVDRLQEKFPQIPRTELERVAQAEFQLLAGRPVRDYLSILTERAAKKRLKKGDTTDA
jgi:hypothetical protein